MVVRRPPGGPGTSRLRTVAVAVSSVAVVVLLGGCTSGDGPPSAATTAATTATATVAPAPQPAAAPAPQPQPAAAGDAGGGRRGGDRGGRGGGAAARPTLPADFPADVPLPAGTVLGVTTEPGRWSVLLASTGPADQVVRSTVALYTAAGFSGTSPAELRRGAYQVSVTAENRDHTDPTAADLTVIVVRG